VILKFRTARAGLKLKLILEMSYVCEAERVLIEREFRKCCWFDPGNSFIIKEFDMGKSTPDKIFRKIRKTIDKVVAKLEKTYKRFYDSFSDIIWFSEVSLIPRSRGELND